MTSHSNPKFSHTNIQPHSIRDELELRAQIQNPKLARRLAKRLETGKTQNDNCYDGARRIMHWQDRILLILGFVLLVLLPS